MDDDGTERGKKEGRGEWRVMDGRGLSSCSRAVRQSGTPPLLTSISFCTCSAGDVVALVGCSSLVFDCIFLFDVSFDVLFDVAAVCSRDVVGRCPFPPRVSLFI